MRTIGMTMLLVGALACWTGCASMTKSKQAVGADEAEQIGTWIGLDATGEAWWRLQLDTNATGRAGIALGANAATYRITHWETGPLGAVSIEMRRDAVEASALDRLPAHIKLSGASDGKRLRLRHGSQELVFWREDTLIRQRNLLKQRMAATP